MSEPRAERDYRATLESAEDGLSDESRASRSASRNGSRGGASTAPTSGGWSAMPPTNLGFCTTGRRMRTTNCTWAASSTWSSRTCSSRLRCSTGSTRSSYRVGTCTGCRSSWKRSSIWGSRISTRSTRSSCARSAANARFTGSTASAKRGFGWETSARGNIRIARSIRRSRRRSSTTLADLAEKRADLQRPARRRSGASTTKRRWPKPRSSTNSKISPSIYVRFPADAQQRRDMLERARACGARASRTQPLSMLDLDDDALDAAGQRRDRVAPGRDVRVVSISVTNACCSRSHSRDRALGERFAQRELAHASPARNSTGWRFGIRSPTAIRSSCSPTTSISKPERAPSTRRPDTAPTISTPA